MRLGGDALQFVLAQRLRAVVEVTGRSMEPTIELGAKVDVVGLAEADPVLVGDIVLVATDVADVRLLHRVVSVFRDGSARMVLHQGDAADSTFGICRREDVMARMTGFAGASAARPLPALERLDANARARFRRRRVAAEAFVRARRVARALGVADLGLVRRCGQAYRKLARALAR